MGNINESPFRGAFFGLIELASWDFEKFACVPHRANPTPAGFGPGITHSCKAI